MHASASAGNCDVVVSAQLAVATVMVEQSGAYLASCPPSNQDGLLSKNPGIYKGCLGLALAR